MQPPGYVPYVREGINRFGYPPGVHFEFIGKAFERLKENLGLYAAAGFVALAVMYGINFALSFGANMMLYGSALGPPPGSDPEVSKILLAQLIQLPTYGLSATVTAGIMLMGIDHINGKPVTFRVFEPFKRIVSITITSILMTLAIVVGLILLIIPGIWLIGALSLAPYYSALDGMGPIASLTKSMEVMKRHAWAMFGFSIITGVVFMLGLCACFIGVIFTFPILCIALAYIWLANNPSWQSNVPVAAPVGFPPPGGPPPPTSFGGPMTPPPG